MSDAFHDAYVAALTAVRDRHWPGVFADYRRLRDRNRERDDYVEPDWEDLQRDIFDATAIAILEIRGVPFGDDGALPPPMVTSLARPVTEAQAAWLARERYWAGAHATFHVLWTREVGRPGYVKADWRALDERIVAAIAAAIVDASATPPN